MIELAGDISMGMLRSTEKDHYNITVRDSKSGLEIISVRIETEQVAYLISNQGHIPCRIELNRADEIGKFHHHKTENIYVRTKSSKKDEREKAAEKAAKPFEVDGWKVDLYNATNGHYIGKHDSEGYWVKLTFHRYMDEPMEKKA
jgi:hypothetical protein